MSTRMRVERVREEAKKEISDIIFKLKDPRIGFITVTDVEVSGDLRHMKVFISTMGQEEERKATMDALVKATGFVRTELGQRIQLRYVPEIQFKHDDSMERGDRIFKLLKEVDPNRSGSE